VVFVSFGAADVVGGGEISRRFSLRTEDPTSDQPKALARISTFSSLNPGEPAEILLENLRADEPVAQPQTISLGYSVAGARGDVSPGVNLGLEKIPQSGELNNMLRRQNRAN
jgi:hypothetical protein